MLTINAITVRLGGRDVWSHVDLSIEPGTFMAVLGPHGSGKSTLIKAVLGVVPLAGGRVDVFGRPAGDGGGDIGYLPQRRSFDPGMRVRAFHRIYNPDFAARDTACRTGATGCGACKKQLFELMNKAIEEFRGRRKAYEQDPAGVDRILEAGNARARAVSAAVMRAKIFILASR